MPFAKSNLENCVALMLQLQVACTIFEHRGSSQTGAPLSIVGYVLCFRYSYCWSVLHFHILLYSAFFCLYMLLFSYGTVLEMISRCQWAVFILFKVCLLSSLQEVERTLNLYRRSWMANSVPWLQFFFPLLQVKNGTGEERQTWNYFASTRVSRAMVRAKISACTWLGSPEIHTCGAGRSTKCLPPLCRCKPANSWRGGEDSRLCSLQSDSTRC